MTDRETGLISNARRVFEGLAPSYFFSYFQNRLFGVTPAFVPPASTTDLIYSIKGQGSSDSTGPVAPYDITLTYEDSTFTWNNVSIPARKVTVATPSNRYSCTESETEFYILSIHSADSHETTNDILYEDGSQSQPPTQDGLAFLGSTPGVPFPQMDSSTGYFKADFLRNTEYFDNSSTQQHGGECLSAYQNNQDGTTPTVPVDECFTTVDKNLDCAPVITLNGRGISVWVAVTSERLVAGTNATQAGYAFGQQFSSLVYIDSGGNLRATKGLDFVRSGSMDHDSLIIELEMKDESGHVTTDDDQWDFFSDPNTAYYGTIGGDDNCAAACGFFVDEALSDPLLAPNREAKTYATYREQMNIHDVSIGWSTTPAVSAEASGGYRTATTTQNVNSRCVFNKTGWVKSITTPTETEINIHHTDDGSGFPIFTLEDMGTTPTFSLGHWLQGYDIQLYFADDGSGGLDACLNVRPHMMILDNCLLPNLTYGDDATDGPWFGWSYPSGDSGQLVDGETWCGWTLEVTEHPFDINTFTQDFEYRYRWVWDGSINGGRGISTLYGTPAAGFDGFTPGATQMNEGADRQGLDGMSVDPHLVTLGGDNLADILNPLISARKSVPTNVLQKGSDGRFLTDTITFSSTDFDDRFNKFSQYFITGGTLVFKDRNSGAPYYQNIRYINVEYDGVPDNTPIIDSATVYLNEPTP